MGSSNYGSSSDDDELGEVDRDGTRERRFQQLRALQSLIPNIRQAQIVNRRTNIRQLAKQYQLAHASLQLLTDDERAILEEARDYLQRIQQDADEIQRELDQRSRNSSSSGASHENHILGVETEELMERRFVVKIRWQRGEGIAGHVQRVIECLDVKMTSIVINDENPDEMLSTAFVKVKKDVQMTEEDLQGSIMGVARRFGLLS